MKYLALFSLCIALCADECTETSLFSADDNISISADVSLLVWQAIVGGLEFAVQNQPIASPNSSINVNGDLIAPDFSWAPACKLNVTAYIANRAWDLNASWTYFHSHSSRSLQANNNLLPLWALPSADMATQFVYSNANGSHALTLNGFDFITGYHAFLSPAFSLCFVGGVKMAQILQDFDVTYNNGFNDGTTQLLSATMNLTNNTACAGPKLGFFSEWHLGNGFTLLGSFAGTIPLWHVRVTRNDSDQNATSGAPQNISSSYHNRYWIFRPILETALGIGWDKNSFGIHASYELQFYSEQNMMTMLVNPGMMNYSFMPRGDLMLHGATLTFHFGF